MDLPSPESIAEHVKDYDCLIDEIEFLLKLQQEMLRQTWSLRCFLVDRLSGGSVRPRWGADSASKARRRMGASFHCLRVPRRDNATRNGRNSLRTAR